MSSVLPTLRRLLKHRTDDAGCYEFVLESWIESAANEIESLRRWIPVAEALPEISDVVWVFDGKEVRLSEYCGGYGFWNDGVSCDREGLYSEEITGVTHWMDIPTPAPPGDTNA